LGELRKILKEGFGQLLFALAFILDLVAGSLAYFDNFVCTLVRKINLICEIILSKVNFSSIISLPS